MQPHQVWLVPPLKSPAQESDNRRAGYAARRFT
ncbi:MAG: hypothetical protein ACD_23C00576G0001, partial [uncultured bacterium]